MDALQLFMTRYAPVHADAEALLEGLADDQIRHCPHPAVNSIAWLLWHMARVEDVAVNRLVGRRPQVIADGGWLERLNVTRRDVGTAMTDGEVADVSARIDVVALRAYWRAVGARTLEVVGQLRSDDLDEVNDAEYVQRVAAADGIFIDRASWVIEYLENKTRGLMLSQLALTHLYSHIGEARVTRALLGFRGR